MQFRPSVNWKAVQAEEAKRGGGGGDERQAQLAALKDKKVKCRICSGDHFTAKCPYKDTMAPVEEGEGGEDPMAEDGEKAAGGLGTGGGGYVPPHLRKGGAAASGGERMGGKYERDDLATLRVTNVSSFVSFSFYFTDYLGIRDGRRARSTRHVRALWTSHPSLPRQRPRDGPGQGLCVYLFR